MKVFISWSGEKSREIGEALKNWLPEVIQALDPFFSPDDIEKGAHWNTEIAEKLNQCLIGIICLTEENLSAPWLLFEAGALSKSLEVSRVCPILFGVEPAMLVGPLTQFQSTRFNLTEITRLMSMINSRMEGRQLQDEKLKKAIARLWPELEQNITEIEAKYVKGKKHRKSPQRDMKEVVEEILEISRFMQSRMIETTKESSVSQLSPAILLELMHTFVNIKEHVLHYGGDMDDKLKEKLNNMEQVIRSIHLWNTRWRGAGSIAAGRFDKYKINAPLLVEETPRNDEG